MTDPGQKLGEALRAAREARGVDVARVERDTKIRSRYVEALERGEYRELPGAVYTKGFLRNYGLYLGLDPEYLIDLYRLETRAPSAERPTIPTAPRPIGRRRRGFVVEPGVIVAAILTIVVGGLIAYLGYEFVTFARTPDLRITAPAGDIGSWAEETYTVQGVTARNARVEISGLAENPSVVADDDGRFEVTVGLVPGSNVMEISAWDPEVSRTSETVRRTITVVGPEPSSAPIGELVLDSPAEGATVAGPIALTGHATPGTVVSVTPALATAAPVSFSVVDPASGAAIQVAPQGAAAPAPLSMTAGADGALSAELALPPGTWDLALASTDGATLARRVVIGPPDGLAVTLDLGGAPSYVEVDVDGQPDARSGSILEAGTSVTLSAREQLRLLAGNAGAVSISVNGLRLGTLGAPDAVVQWQITRNP
ncbi:MAG: RodZ domain-containing protein [Chloroflexota bacterium]